MPVWAQGPSGGDEFGLQSMTTVFIHNLLRRPRAKDRFSRRLRKRRSSSIIITITGGYLHREATISIS